MSSSSHMSQLVCMASSSSSQPKCPDGTAPESTPNRLCAYDLCDAMENLKLCSRCKGTWYCSREHQHQHWKTHKKSCHVTNVSHLQEGKDKHAEKACKEKGTELNTGNRRKSEAERSRVQEDIAQFSANIRRKHSYNLTPCDNEEDAVTQEVESKNDVNQSAGIESREIQQEQENMPPNEPSLSNTHPGRNTNALVRYVSEHMRKFGICVVDKFLRQENGDAILDEVKGLRENDAFRNGQLVTSRETGSTSSREIRGDMITWTDGSYPETRNIGFLISKIDSIVQQCKGHLEGFKNINGRTEAMVACYPGNGAHYVKHVDNPNEDGRCVTCIYYLNKGWDSKRMGGSLMLYPRGHDMICNVEPIFNRLIFFWSDRRNPHEVMPAYNTRYAITVWYFDAVERKKALASALN